MAFTAADLTALDRAIKGGALKVEYADRVVWYRSLDEMIRIRGLIQADIDAAAGATPPPRYSFAGYRPG